MSGITAGMLATKVKLIISAVSFSYFIFMFLETRDRVLIALQTGKEGKRRK